MSIFGNLLWIILGGLISSIIWAVAGIILCVTVIGIPLGLQCLKIAGLVIAPFGRKIENRINPVSIIGNIIWILLLGWELAIYHLAFALILGITIIGIPFAVQHLKLAQLSLLPFGAEIY